jgi:FMN phosphatase YigB (HAD superfamily)
MNEKRQTIFLLDVDNTLLDNDHLEQDLKEHLDQAFGVDCRNHYWEIFEALRGELGYADYLGALQRYRAEHTRNPHILEISSFLINYRFANRLYPGALETIKRLRSFGRPVILSDGDAVFQPRKIERSGIWKAVRGHVLIYIHKEQMLDDVAQKYPAEHYFMVDDKVRILAAMKSVWGGRLTTVFVRQGHYAKDQASVQKYPPADFEIEGIADLVELDLASASHPLATPAGSDQTEHA